MRRAPTALARGRAGCLGETTAMNQNALSALQAEGLDLGGLTVKRAQWEAFEAVLAGRDRVNIRNASYGDEGGHTYTVTVREGVPTACSCPADRNAETPCKHRVAVALRQPILAAFTALAADESADETEARAEQDRERPGVRA